MKALNYFKKNWYVLTLYQLISALIMSVYSWFIVFEIKKRMDLVSKLTPEINKAGELLQEDMTNKFAFDVVNQLDKITNEIIILTIFLVVGLFFIYTYFEGILWKKIVSGKKRYLLRFAFLNFVFFMIIWLLLLSNLGWILQIALSILFVGWLFAGYVSIKDKPAVKSIFVNWKKILKASLVVFLGLILLSASIFLGYILNSNYFLTAILMVVGLEIFLFLKVWINF